MRLNFGVVDIPYAQRPRAASRRRRRAPIVSGQQTTGDIAEILEGRYHIMEVFAQRYDDQINEAIEESLLAAMESQLMGAPQNSDPMAAALAKIEQLFREFLDTEGMNGQSGVPTEAALRGVNHRLMHPNARSNPPRPSFIDTGQFQAAFRAWLEELMARLSAKLRSIEGGRLGFWCPGCDGVHVVRVTGTEHPLWTWDGDVDNPTFSPSILVTYDGADADEDDAPPERCHSFVKAGKIEFLGDCTHKLAGQIAEIPDFPANYGGV